MSLNSLLVINAYLDKVNNYNGDKNLEIDYNKLENDRLDVFKMFQDGGATKQKGMYQGHQPPSIMKSAIGEDLMTAEELVDKGQKLKDATKNGWIYSFDTETFGTTSAMLEKEIEGRRRTGHPGISAENLDEIRRANSEGHIMTEFYMSKQYYQDGKPMSMADGKWIEGIDRIEVYKKTYAKSYADMKILAEKAQDVKGAGDLLFNLNRAAGSAGDAYAPNSKYPSKWNTNGDILNGETIEEGINNMIRHANHVKGEPGFKNAAQELMNVLDKAADDGNSIFETLNGNDFDLPVVFNFLEEAGLDVSDDYKNKIMNKHVDAQKIIASTKVKGVVYNDINARKDQLIAESIAAYKSGNSIKGAKLESQADAMALGITNESIANGANARKVLAGKEPDIIKDTHVGEADVGIMQSGLEVYHGDMINAIDEIENQTKSKVGSSTSTIYTANRAVMFDKSKDLYFSTSFGPDGNTYNNVGMEAGHSYKLSVHKFADDTERFGGKKVLEMEDQHEYIDGVRRKSYLVLGNEKQDIQEKILNAGNVETRPTTMMTPDVIKKTTENALADKARREKAGWFSVNSDSGFKSFDNYVGVLEDFRNNTRNGKTALNEKEAIEGLFRTGKINVEGVDKTLKEVMPGLFSAKKGFENNLIQERTSTFLGLYDDLNQNFNYYNSLRTTVNNKIGSVSTFKSKAGIQDDYAADYEYNKAKTAMLYEVRENTDDELIKGLDKDKIIERFYGENQRADINARVNRREKQLSKETNLGPTERLAQAREELFEDNFGFKYDAKNKAVKDSIIGHKAIEKDSRNLSQLDIMGDNAEYTRIRTDSIQNIEADLDNKLNIDAIKNKPMEARPLARESYIKNVAGDLLTRGMISDHGYKSIINSNHANPYQKTTLLAEAIFKQRQRVEGVARSIGNRGNFAENVLGGLDYNLIKGQDAKGQEGLLKTYLNNMHMNAPKVAEGGVETLLGMNKDALLNKVTDNGKLSNELASRVTEGIDSVVSNIFTFNAEDKSKNKAIKDFLMKDYKYSSNNADLFIDGIINNPKNSEYINSKTGKPVKDGVTNMIKEIDGQGYLITAPKDRQLRIEQMLIEQNRNGSNIDELKKVAMVYKLDKITDRDGIREIRSSEASAKAITKNVVASKSKVGGELVYNVRDTMDNVLLSFKHQYENGLKEMSMGNLDRANTIVNYSRKEINENKSRSATVITGVQSEGKTHYLKRQKLSVADSMLNQKLDMSDMIYTLDTVLADEPLRKKLTDSIGNNNVERLLGNIETYKKKPWLKDNALSFEGQEVGTKLWFAMNTKEIAEKLSSNDAFMGNNPELESVLNTMKTHGSSLFLSKESGEAGKGIINLDPTHEYAAGSHLSGASRPLINQVLNAKPITESDMLALANDSKVLGKGYKDIAELTGDLDIKFNRSYITNRTLDIETTSSLLGEHQAFSAKVKYMDAEEFAGKINDAMSLTGEEDWVKKIMAEHKGMTPEKIRKTAEGIGNVTSVYEDSGAIDPALARTFEQRGVTVEEVTDGSKYHLNQQMNGKEIIGIEGNKITLQNIDKYYDVKVGLGYGEKAELHSYNAANAEEARAASAVFKHISGGASAVMDPSFAKHDAFSSMFSTYSNAITNNIHSQTEADTVNQILAKRMPDHKHDVREVNGRYVLVEGVRAPGAEFDGLKAFENVVNDIKNIKGGYGARVTKDVDDIEKNGIGYADFALMSDNTIEKPFGFLTDKDGKVVRDGGAKINYRSQQAIGMFIGDDPLSEISKYRQSKGGKSVGILGSIIDKDIKQLLNNKGFITDMKQSANIGSALLLGELHGRDKDFRTKRAEKDLETKKLFDEYEGMAKKSRVVDMSLEEAVSGMTQMTAEEIPNTFKMHFGDKHNPIAVNSYRIKLDNMNLINPEYADLVNPENKRAYAHLFGNKTAEKYAEGMGIKETINEIYIPAMDTNRIGEKYTLTRVQRAANDLLKNLHGISKGMYGDLNLNQMQGKANELLSVYHDSLRFELTDKNGFYKRSLNIRSENSARFKMANIAAPVVDGKGQYLNSYFKDRATRLVDGKVEYRQVQVVKASDLFGTKVDESFTNIGKQLVHENIDSSDEAFRFLRQYGEGNTIEEVKNGLRKNANISDDMFKNMGKEYLEKVGFDAMIMRDPAMLSTSYQTTRTFVNDQVIKGTTWIDAVAAKWMNADGDGDEINAFYHRLTGGKKGFKLLNEGDADGIQKSLAQDMENKINVNSSEFSKLVNGRLKNGARTERAAARTLAGYNEQVMEVRAMDFTDEASKIINVDYINGGTKVANLLSRFLKGSIGQVSNPNYYLKAASSFYAGSRGDTIANLNSQRNIQMLTDLTEQSLIDIKSVKNIDDANAIAKLAGSYRANMDNLAILGTSDDIITKRKSAMVDMISQVGKILNEKGGTLADGTDRIAIDKDTFGESKEAILKRNEMASRILNGERHVIDVHKGDGTTVEAILADAYTVLQDESANQVFFSANIRQTDLAYRDGQKIPMWERAKRALGGVGIGEQVQGKLFEESGAQHFLQQTPIVDNQILSRGDIIHSSDVSKNITPGVFKLDKIYHDKGEAKIKLRDLSNDSEIVMAGKDFGTLSKSLNGYKPMQKYGEVQDLLDKVKEQTYNNYSKKAAESFEGFNQVFKSSSNTDSLNDTALEEVKKVFHEKRTEDMLTDIEILKNNKLASNDELSELRRNMNEAIKNKASDSTYRETRKAEMLKLKSVKSLNVNTNNFEAWNDTKFGSDVKELTRKLYFYDKDIDKLKNNLRYNIDEVTNHLNKTYDGILANEEFKNMNAETLSQARSEGLEKRVKNFADKDAKTLGIVQDIYEKNMSNPEFKEQVLKVDLNKALEMASHDKQGAMNMLGETTVSYGNYAGFKLNQLGTEKADEILAADYMIGIKQSIDPSVKEETEKIIQKMKNLEGKDGIIRVNPADVATKQVSKEYGENYISQIRKEMNDSIKARGQSVEREASKFSVGSMFNKAKTAFTEMSGTKKKVLAGAAIGIGALGALALASSGEKTLYEDNNKYKKEDRDLSTVKTAEPTKQGSYQNVPSSDSRFYTNQNNGLAVNVSGDAPQGASPRHSGNILEMMGGGDSLNLNTSFNDSRTTPSDSDIDDMMSNATTY